MFKRNKIKKIKTFLFLSFLFAYIEASSVGRIRRRVPERTFDTLSLEVKVGKTSVCRCSTDICIFQNRTTGRSTSRKILCIHKETNNIYAMKCQQKHSKRSVDAIVKCPRHYNRQDLWPSSHPDILSHSVVDKERLDQLLRPEIQDHLKELQSTCDLQSGIEFTNDKDFIARVFCYKKNGQNILYFENKRPGQVISKKIWVI